MIFCNFNYLFYIIRIQMQKSLKEQETEYDKSIQRANVDRAKYDDMLLKSIFLLT